MMLHRSLPLILMLAVLPLPAVAQIGNLPGWASLPACQQLLADRDEAQRHAAALRDAGQRKAQPDEVCTLFKAFLAAEAKMMAGLKDNATTCRVPTQLLKSVASAHSKAGEMADRVCEAMGGGPPSRRWCFNTLVPGLSCRLSAVE
jgi:hypothetical protein